MSILSATGNVVRKIFGFAVKAAVVAEPIVLAAYPGIGPLYDTALKGALVVETTTVSGSGPDKITALTSTLLSQAHDWAAKNGVEWPEADVKKWASAVVDSINLIPAPKTK